MASVALDTIWLHDADNEADRIELEWASGLTRNPDEQVDVRRMASGRYRSFQPEPNPTTWQISFDLATAREVEWLDTHRNRHICVRDHRGQKMFGTYAGVPETVLTADGRSALTLTITEVTVSEVRD